MKSATFTAQATAEGLDKFRDELRSMLGIEVERNWKEPSEVHVHPMLVRFEGEAEAMRAALEAVGKRNGDERR